MNFDVIVIGAGAAGMMCAAQAGQRGRRVLLVDHAERIGERIRVSGGGRCNFSNRDISAEHFLSQNPHFCRSALARFNQWDFIAMVEARGIAYHERDHGQLFCDTSAREIIDMLQDHCAAAGVQWAQPCSVKAIQRVDAPPYRFSLTTDRGTLSCHSLVISSGGLAVPKMGATPFGYRVAEQFGLNIVPPQPALVPLALNPTLLAQLQPLSGVSIDAVVHCATAQAEGATPAKASLPSVAFRENVLITHRGLSGPAILQISSYWQMQGMGAVQTGKRGAVVIDLLPGLDAEGWLLGQRDNKARLSNALAGRLPRRFAQAWCTLSGEDPPLNVCTSRTLSTLAHALKHWALMPAGTLGYAKAEVTLGGVDTQALSSKTMAAKAVPGLYFIGEVVDVTGWLGGYNFQWAWSSGWVAGQFA
jgi:predicted Rossmann fold flavoprotein